MVTCRSCKTTNKAGDRFCINCGTSLESAPISQPQSTAAAEERRVESENRSRPKGLVIIGLVGMIIAGVAAGTMLTANGVMEPVIGVRYTQRQLEAAEKKRYDAGYQSGFDAGDAAGYDRGYDDGSSAGYSSGYGVGLSKGCNDVFDQIAENIIAIYYPYNRFSLGSGYHSRFGTCN